MPPGAFLTPFSTYNKAAVSIITPSAASPFFSQTLFIHNATLHVTPLIYFPRRRGPAVAVASISAASVAAALSRPDRKEATEGPFGFVKESSTVNCLVQKAE